MVKKKNPTDPNMATGMLDAMKAASTYAADVAEKERIRLSKASNNYQNTHFTKQDTPIDSVVSQPPAPTPTPPAPPPPPPVATSKSVKQPSPSLVEYSAEGLPQELITDLLYEDVGGTELINIARYDTVDGQDVSYSLVRNLSVLNKSFNPSNILAGQIAYSSQLGQYALDLSVKINSISLDADGNLVIDLSSIGSDEYVEVEISSNGTIYKIGV